MTALHFKPKNVYRNCTRAKVFIQTAITFSYHFEHLYSPCSELTVISGDDGGLSELVYKVVDRWDVISPSAPSGSWLDNTWYLLCSVYSPSVNPSLSTVSRNITLVHADCKIFRSLLHIWLFICHILAYENLPHISLVFSLSKYAEWKVGNLVDGSVLSSKKKLS